MINPRDLFKAAHPVFEESQQRPLRLTNVQVIDKTPDPQSQNLPYGFPGSLTVFVARKGSGAMDELRTALAGNVDQIVSLYQKIENQLQAVAQPATVDDAVQNMIKEPVFADLCYGGTTLVQSVWLPQGLDMTLLFLAYNGGRLAPEGFILAEHYKEDANVALEALIVRSDPPLTQAEKAAVQQAPPDQAINNVYRDGWCDTTWWGVGAAAVGLGLFAAGLCPATPIAFVAARPTGHNLEPHIADQTLQQLGPAASARAILKARRDVLTNILSR